MYSYHVYFSTRHGTSESELQSTIRHFIETEKRRNLMLDGRLLTFTDKASFSDLPDHHFVADYASKADMENAMANMKARYREEPHASLMKIASDFRVAFSESLL